MDAPDFERLADLCLSRVYGVRGDGLLAEHAVVVEALRQVWNARGSADLKAINGYTFQVAAIKALDR